MPNFFRYLGVKIARYRKKLKGDVPCLPHGREAKKKIRYALSRQRVWAAQRGEP